MLRGELQDFDIQEGYLVLVPVDPAVVPKTKTNHVLASLNTENDQGLGKAVLSLYKFVRDKYLTITRQEVCDYNLGEPDYQLVKESNTASTHPLSPTTL